MTLRFMDGFDHYTTLTEKWTSTNVAGTGTVAISAGNGRRSSASLRLTLSNQNQYVQKVIDAQATWTVGFWYKVSSFASAPIILSFMDDTVEHMRLAASTSGLLVASRAGTTLGTSSSGLTLNVGAYIEYKVTISDAAGAYEVRVNGASVLSGSSADTRNGGNASANILRLGNAANQTFTADYDDLYLCDGQGSVNNTFLGDTKIEVKYPNATGTTNDWTASTGTAANGYQLLDETAPNGDTDYLSSSTVNQLFTYGVENLSNATGTIHGVQTCLYARKDDAGTRTVAPVCRSGTTDYVGSNVNLGDTYAYLLSIRETDPDTAAAWTVSGFNSAEQGVKLIA